MSEFSQLIRCQFGGVDFAGEVWRTTLDLWGAEFAWSPGTPLELLAACQSIGNVFNTSLWAILKQSNRPGVDYSYCRIAQMQGDTVLGAVEDMRVPIPGTNTTVTLAGSSAVVVSKRTNVSTRAGRGRAYLPLTASALETTSGQIANAQVDSFAAAYADLCDDLGALTLTFAGLSANYHPVVVSGWGSGNPTPRRITRVSVDSRVDRQVRRQRNAPSQHEATVSVVG